MFRRLIPEGYQRFKTQITGDEKSYRGRDDYTLGLSGPIALEMSLAINNALQNGPVSVSN